MLTYSPCKKNKNVFIVRPCKETLAKYKGPEKNELIDFKF